MTFSESGPVPAQGGVAQQIFWYTAFTADMVKPGAVVVAAGVSFEGKKLLSDVADEVGEVAGWLSPRIGGVGPMTRAMLLVNTVLAAERRAD